MSNDFNIFIFFKFVNNFVEQNFSINTQYTVVIVGMITLEMHFNTVTNNLIKNVVNDIIQVSQNKK